MVKKTALDKLLKLLVTFGGEIGSMEKKMVLVNIYPITFRNKDIS